ncbi:hypothetical protein [Streptomyces niveus]|uniref:hypothetical protein n=1 Tax=Streptomyces niveus TaxID=193462 RepID=UPI00368D4C3F
MAKLIYSMITSLDGYAEDDLFRPVGTYLYGRRMYETMVYWETAHTEPDQMPHILRYARDWQAAEKIVYSTSVVGGGKRFFPDGVRLDLELVEERAFGSGLIYARYRTR